MGDRIQTFGAFSQAGRGGSQYFGNSASATTATTASDPLTAQEPISKVPKPTRRVFGIVCTRDHEYSEMVRLLSVVHHAEPSPPRFAMELSRFSLPTHDIVLASFGKVQGPFEAAGRTARFLKEVPDVTHVGMVGICGGSTLHQVIVGVSSVTPELGRYQYTDGTVSSRWLRFGFHGGIDLCCCWGWRE